MTDLAKLKQSVSLSSVVRQRTALKKDGGRHKGLCPFHGERTPSFEVDDAKGKYHCYGCGEDGDVFDFLKAFFGLNIPEAKEYLGGGETKTKLTPVKDMPPPVEEKAIETFVKVLPTKKAPALMDGRKTVTIWNPKRRGTEKEFTKLTPSAIYEYNAKDGTLLGYVLRVDFKDGGKFTPTIQFCRDTDSKEVAAHWTMWRFDEPRPLYRMDELEDDGAVVIVEGEKCADALGGFVDNVITWPQGTSNFAKADWSMLDGRDVIIWPDNDKPGHEVTYGKPNSEKNKNGIIHMLNANSIKVIVPPKNKPKGWDCADAIRDGDDVLDIIANANPCDPAHFTTEEAPVDDVDPTYEPEIDYSSMPTQEAPPPAAQPAAGESVPNRYEDVFANAPFRLLGHNGDHHYFMSKQSAQLHSFKASSLQGITALMTLAPLAWWENNFTADGKSFNAARIVMAVNALMQSSFRKKIFSPTMLRGRGLWMDGEECVTHLGDKVYIDGKETESYDYDSDFIYEHGTKINVDIENPMGAEEAMKFVEISEMFHWETAVHAKLFAGWIALAPICGMLEWRPHIWITAPSGGGKSYIVDKAIKAILGDFGLHIRAGTSEPGIRAALRIDALPVLFDESEGEDDSAKQAVASILRLVRGSSSAGGDIIKGGDGSTGGIFKIQSMFAFASIGVGVKGQADQSRVSVLSLRKDSSPAGIKKFEEVIHPAVTSTLTPEYCSRLMSRSISMAKTIRKNAEVFGVVANSMLRSTRLGDQVGALMAGAYSLHSDDVATPEIAMEWMKAQDWNEQAEITQARDELQLIQKIAQTSIRFEYDSKHYERSIGEVVAVAAHDSVFVSQDMKDDTNVFENKNAIEAILNRLGLKVERNDVGQQVLGISDTHNEIARLLRNTSFSVNWAKILLRIDGAERSKGSSRFGQTSSRCVFIPIKHAIYQEETEF